jgi:hypothetical protein
MTGTVNSHDYSRHCDPPAGDLLPPPVAFAGDPRPLAIGNCYLGEPDDRPADRAVTGGRDVELGAVRADDGLPRAAGAVLFGITRQLGRFMVLTSRKWRVSSVCPCRR